MMGSIVVAGHHEVQHTAQQHVFGSGVVVLSDLGTLDDRCCHHAPAFTNTEPSCSSAVSILVNLCNLVPHWTDANADDDCALSPWRFSFTSLLAFNAPTLFIE